MAYQCFGNGAVDAIHRHMIAVVGGPAQRQFRQIAGAYYHTAGLIGNVHQYLGAFSRLSVFKGDAVVGKIMSDVGKMGFYRITDIHSAEGYPQFLTQLFRIGAGAIGGAEAGHGDSDNICAGPFQQIHSADSDQQCQGGVQSAGNANYRCFRPRVHQPFFQSLRLNGENQFTAFSAMRLIVRHKG